MGRFAIQKYQGDYIWKKGNVMKGLVGVEDEWDELIISCGAAVCFFL